MWQGDSNGPGVKARKERADGGNRNGWKITGGHERPPFIRAHVEGENNNDIGGGGAVLNDKGHEVGRRDRIRTEERGWSGAKSSRMTCLQ